MNTEKPTKTRTKVKRGCLGFIALPVLIFIIYSALAAWIPAGEVGLIYNASGGLENRVYKPQRIFLRPTQKLYTYPTRLQAAIYSQDPNYGENRAADGILVTTNDNAQTVYDVVVYYRIKPENVITVFNEFGAIGIEQVQSQHIRRFVKEAASAVGTEYGVFELMTSKRQEACAKVKARLESTIGRRGITIEQVYLLSPQPQGDVGNKIMARVNGYTGLTTSQLRSQIADLDRQIAVVRGETEAKARSIVAAQSNEKSLTMQRLELSEAAVEAWNGKLPAVQPNGNQTIIINGSSSNVIPNGRQPR